MRLWKEKKLAYVVFLTNIALFINSYNCIFFITVGIKRAMNCKQEQQQQ